MTIERSYDERLVYMANQIAKNFGVLGTEEAIVSTRDHIRLFWDPRMRTRILALVEDEAAGLEETTRAALLGLPR